jgi:hypothetical protein
MKASIYRDPVDPNDWIALDIYAGAVAEMLQGDESRMLGRYAHLAEAQHYGMRTHLLDFTADPRVAVYMACRCGSASIQEEAVVYFFPLNVLAEIGGAVVLPPPWVRRLYLQRGLFVDCAKIPAGLDLQDRCQRILFPRSKDFTKSAIDGVSGDFEPPEPWYERAIAWARVRATTFELDQADMLAAEMRKECGDPPFVIDSLLLEKMADSLEQITDMCEWLTLKVVDGVYHFDLNSLDVLLQQNARFFRSVLATWKFLSAQFEGLSQGPMLNDRKLARKLAALAAISQCVEEAARSGRLPRAESH